MMGFRPGFHPNVFTLGGRQFVIDSQKDALVLAQPFGDAMAALLDVTGDPLGERFAAGWWQATSSLYIRRPAYDVEQLLDDPHA